MEKWAATRKHVGSQSDKRMLGKEGGHENLVKTKEPGAGGGGGLSPSGGVLSAAGRASGLPPDLGLVLGEVGGRTPCVRPCQHEGSAFGDSSM